MGAKPFRAVAAGDSAEAAFRAAVAEAEYEHGHGGYSGTIAEKSLEGFRVIRHRPLPMDEADALAARLEDEYEEIRDSRGPAGAIPLDDGRWLFFGWAAE